MTSRELYKLRTELSSLAVFRSVLSDKVISALLGYLECFEEEYRVYSYAEFVSALYSENGGDLSAHIESITFAS